MLTTFTTVIPLRAPPRGRSLEVGIDGGLVGRGGRVIGHAARTVEAPVSGCGEP